MGKVIYPRKGEVHTAPVTIRPNFADNTWEQIIECCETNTVPATWVVGEQKSMTINGTDYLIDIIGKNHDDYADGSGKAPLTFQMHDCYVSTAAIDNVDTSVNGWTGCQMRILDLPALLALMPSEVQDGIKEVRKLTSAGNLSTTINFTADKLFLLSEVEIFGRGTGYNWNSFEGEGNQYDYYASGNSPVKYLNGTAKSWWERSPLNYTNRGYCRVSETGLPLYNISTYANGVSFAFCF